jgi:hypothetical protein
MDTVIVDYSNVFKLLQEIIEGMYSNKLGIVALVRGRLVNLRKQFMVGDFD